MQFIEVAPAHFDLLKCGTSGVFVTPRASGGVRIDAFPVGAAGCTVKAVLADAEGRTVAEAEAPAEGHTVAEPQGGKPAPVATAGPTPTCTPPG